MQKKTRSQLLCYSIPGLSVALTLLLALWLDIDSPLLLMQVAVVVSAGCGGLIPGLLSTILAALASNYFFILPDRSFTIGKDGAGQLVLFLVEGGLISSIIEALHAALRRVEMQLLELQSRHESLRQSEEQFRLLVDGVKDYALFLLDSDGRVLTWNAGAEFLIGYPAQEILGQPFARLFPLEAIDRGEPEQELRVAIADGQTETERWHVRKDGTRFWASELLVALRGENDTLQGFAKVVRNITERKQAEDEQRSQEGRFRRLFESNVIGVIFPDMRGHIHDANDAFLEMVGYTREDLQAGRVRWVDMTPPEYSHLDEKALESIRARGACTPFEKEYIRKDGSRVPILLACAILEGSEQDTVSFVLDLTERKRTEAELQGLYQQLQELNAGLEQQVQERTVQLHQQMRELQRLNQLKDDFLSTVSHELRTPVTNMKMAIHMLQVATQPEQRERYMKILEEECTREISLVNDLLDLQRLEAGEEPVELEPIELQAWLPAIVQPFSERAQAREQTLRLEIESELPTVLSQASSLQRAIVELLNNACKYTPPGAAIEVAARLSVPVGDERLSDGVELVVSNTGTEISTSELTRIFEKFYRVPSSDPWRQRGTGLGLALVQKLVDLMGGWVRAESQGGKITFTIWLPRSKARST